MLQAPQELEHTRSEPHPKLYEYIHATPTDRSAILLPHGQSLDLKLETEQETESFKSRGAVNWLLNHPEHHTVITASAGSFGPGLAYGTDVLGRRAIVFMPKTTPEPKIQAVKDYGGEVHLSGESFSDTEPAMLAFAKENNFPVAHPFNDPDVIAGYRTVFDEILADSDEPTTIAVPCGGGSLAAAASQAALMRENVTIVAGMFSDNRSLIESLKAGHPVTIDQVDTRCEGSAVKRIGDVGLYDLKELYYQVGRLHTQGVSPAALGRAIQAEIYRRAQLEADYGDEAYRQFPETTAFIAEAALTNYILRHPTKTGRFVAVRTGSHTDSHREEALLDTYQESLRSSDGSTVVWRGPQLR